MGIFGEPNLEFFQKVFIFPEKSSETFPQIEIVNGTVHSAVKSPLTWSTFSGALRKLCFHFLSQWMGYDRGDSFLSILNQIKFHLVSNRKENCHHDHIPFSLKGIGNRVFSVFILDIIRAIRDSIRFNPIKYLYDSY